MAKSLQSILGYQTLTGVINDPAGGVPADLMPPAFITPTRTVSGDSFKFYKVSGNRRTASLVQRAAPAVKKTMKGVSEVPAVCMNFRNELEHSGDLYLQLADPNNGERQMLAQAEIARQTADARTELNNTRMSCVYSIFRHGAIYFDGNGNLLPTSSGAVTTVSMQIPAGNQNQLDVLGTGAIIGASWGTAGTSILGDIKALKQAARQLSGYPIRHAFYGTNIPGYILANTELSSLVQGSPVLSEAFASSSVEIPSPFLGLQWHPVYEAFFEDQDGTNQSWFGADTVVFTPDPDPTWWEVVQGTTPVPRQLGRVGGDASDMIGDVAEVAGMYSYATLSHNPVSIRQIYGDCVLPTLKVPNAVFIADVTP